MRGRSLWEMAIMAPGLHFLNRLSNADFASSAAAFLGGPFEVRLAGMKKSQKFAFSLFDTHSACGSRHLL
jgi:hypothetical protein